MFRKLQCVVLQVIDPHASHLDPQLAEKKLRELEQLVFTAGGEIVAATSQHRVTPHPSTYVGGGKIEWLKSVVEEHQIDVVILNSVVKAGQLFRIERMLWEINPLIKVWDRVDLILHIFELHAQTVEAKLQIQLARIQHLGPRIYGLGGTELSRQGGGRNAKGSGETNTEFEKRKMKLQKQQIQKQLTELNTSQLERIRQRKDQQTHTVALVGYTSAGKTSLFNALTGKERETNQSLFTTLDSIVGRVKLADHTHGVLVSDTIGFIEDLPPQLIEAFRTSLLVSLEAQVVCHVIDAADPFLLAKFETVESILTELGVTSQPILVFNKVDLIAADQRAALLAQFPGRTAFFTSTKTGEGLEELKAMMQ